MERLTIRRKNGVIQSDLKQKENAMSRLAAIEDILGDSYDLDRLRELVQADREGRCVVLPCKVGDKMQYIDGYESIGSEIVEKIVIEIETDRGIYSANELKPEDFEYPRAQKALEEMEGE